MRQATMARIVGGLLVTVMAAAGPFTSCEAGNRSGDLADARQRWATAQVDDYTWNVELLCFCPELPGAVEMTIVDGRVVATSVPVDADYPRTVEDVFDIIEANLKASEMQVLYHRQLGYPITVNIDPIAEAVDEETTYIMSDFQAG